jgi:uncharacterized membrane protein
MVSSENISPMPGLLKNIPAYALTLLVFLALDMLWLGVLSKDLYRRSIGHLMSSQVNWTAAVVFYIIFLCGLFILVVHPSVVSGSVKQVLVMSAVYGLCTYATYDLTNLATLKEWPVRLVFIDIAWGIFLNMATGLAGYLFLKWLA